MLLIVTYLGSSFQCTIFMVSLMLGYRKVCRIADMMGLQLYTTNSYLFWMVLSGHYLQGSSSGGVIEKNAEMQS